MGESLTPYMESFFDETGNITKSASKFKALTKFMRIGGGAPTGPSLSKAVGEAAGRIRHPIKGLKAGWRSMAPRTHERTLGEIGKEVLRTKGGTTTPWWKLPFLRAQSATHIVPRAREAVEGGKRIIQVAPLHPEKVPLLNIVRGRAAGQPASRIQALAGELSRRGWTGKSRAMKYLPVGEKSMLAGFTGAAVPSVLQAPKATPLGEESTESRALGELGGLGGWILGSGLGIPGMALWYGAHKGGTLAGRALGRMRAGAPLRQAISAPSPEEAREQLGDIATYYGQKQ